MNPILFIINTFRFLFSFIELLVISVEYSVDKQHRSGRSNIISMELNRQTTSSDNKILAELTIVSKSRYLFFQTLYNINLIHIFD